jgi:hypothetical protein
MASVQVDGLSSGKAVEINSVRPVISTATANLDATETTLTIDGFGFSPTATGETVIFSNGVKGKIASNSTATQLFITNLTGLVAGNLTAIVTVDGFSSLSEQIATVIPDIFTSEADLAPTAKTLVIHGAGFSSNNHSDIVTFSGGVTGTVMSATATTLTVSDLMGLTAGPLNVITVTSNGISNTTSVEVAEVT